MYVVWEGAICCWRDELELMCCLSVRPYRVLGRSEHSAKIESSGVTHQLPDSAE